MRSLIKDLTVNNGTLVIPPELGSIPDSSCAGREDIRRIVFPLTLYSIAPEAFAECTALEEVVFPPSFRHVSAAAFLNCTALSRVVLSRDLRSIEEGAFLGCTALKTLQLPETLESIGEMAFWGSGLEEIVIPRQTERIAENAFWDCAALHRADVLGSGTVIEKNAFGNCPALTEGFIAPGFPADDSAPARLLYTLLWCTCPERHSHETAQRAMAFVREEEGLVMERIIKTGNTAALAGLIAQGLPDGAHMDEYIRICAKEGSTELTALLLQGKRGAAGAQEEFDL